nr:hypothetical protein [Streptomyces sp. SID3343]
MADDALDLLEVLIAKKLLARAERETAKQKQKTPPRMERAGIRPATAFRVVFDTTSEQVDTESGAIGPPEVATLTAMWERIEEVVPREEPAAAIAALFEPAPPPIDSDADEARRTMQVTRLPTVRLRPRHHVIKFAGHVMDGLTARADALLDCAARVDGKARETILALLEDAKDATGALGAARGGRPPVEELGRVRTELREELGRLAGTSPPTRQPADEPVGARPPMARG